MFHNCSFAFFGLYDLSGSALMRLLHDKLSKETENKRKCRIKKSQDVLKSKAREFVFHHFGGARGDDKLIS